MSRHSISEIQFSSREGYELSAEPLEDRNLLTAFVFVDYGDNFPSGTLTTTQGAFRDVANDAVAANRILGTTLVDSANAFNAGTQLDIVAQTFTATERAQMLAVVQRAYLPLDITVVELTATAQLTSDGRSVAAATSMADVINTLRGGNAAFRDAYVFVATFIVDPGGANQQVYGNNGGGNSPGGPNGTILDTPDLGTASNVHDDVAVVFSNGGLSNNTLNNISHEAGHLLGLQHAITNPATAAATNLFHQLELMSYRNTNNTTSSTFTRFPMIRGDDNSPAAPPNPVNYNDLAARAGQVTTYDQLRFDANVGANPNFNFVTGTGAHDIITITRNGANADVTVQAFGDSAYTSAITVPGEADTTFSYSVPLTTSLLVYAGDSNDRIVINGDLGVTVQLDGMLGTDSLIVDGQGAGSAVYTPATFASTGVDLNTSFAGTIALGAMTLNFVDFETNGSIELQDIGTVSYAGSSGVDDLTLNRSAGGDPQVTGTVNGGTGVVPLLLSGVNQLAVDTAGAADRLTVNFATGNPVPVGGIAFTGGEAGGGTDEIFVTGAAGPNNWSVTGLEAGSIPSSNISFNQVEALRGGATVDIFTLSDGNLGVLIDGGNGTDEIQGPNFARTWNLTGAQAGDVSVSNVTFTAIEVLNGGNAADQFVVAIGGTGMLVHGGGSNDDNIEGPNIANVWTIDGSNQGTLSPNIIDFLDVENIIGGTNTDQFVFLALGGLSGEIDGDAGFDEMNFGSTGSVRTLLTGLGSGGGAFGFNGTMGGGVPLGGGFANIDRVVGSLAGISDELVGINGPSKWTYLAAIGLYEFQSRTLEFSNQEILTGQDFIDRFNVAPLTSAPLNINGGLPIVLPGDLLKVQFAGVSNPQLIVTGPGNGLFTFDPPHQIILYTSIERLDVFDYGDAPVSYGTTTSSGARHRLGSNLKLGSALDPESNGQPSGQANKDDLTGSPDDEDGVLLPTTLVAEFRAAVNVNATGSGKLDAWIDFNANGAFDSDEQILSSASVVAGENRFEFRVPGSAVAGSRFVRFRLSTAGGLGPTGQAEDGEVEDYKVAVFVLTPGTGVVLDDPLAPGESKRMLFAAGTSGNDELIVEPFGDDHIRVVLTGQPIFGPFPISPIQRLGVLGGYGNDRLIINNQLTIPAEIYANAGNDVVYSGLGDDVIDGGGDDDVIYGYAGKDEIYGRAGNDVLYGMGSADILLGGDGDDWLYGGAGRDLLIGGTGSDQLFGETGDDLLIGGTTVYDADWSALPRIMAEWYSGRSYETRIFNLRNGLGPVLNATGLYLQTGTTVLNDGAIDELFSGSDRDWFFALSLDDQLKDIAADEFVN